MFTPLSEIFNEKYVKLPSSRLTGLSCRNFVNLVMAAVTSRGKIAPTHNVYVSKYIRCFVYFSLTTSTNTDLKFKPVKEL